MHGKHFHIIVPKHLGVFWLEKHSVNHQLQNAYIIVNYATLHI